MLCGCVLTEGGSCAEMSICVCAVRLRDRVLTTTVRQARKSPRSRVPSVTVCVRASVRLESVYVFYQYHSFTNQMQFIHLTRGIKKTQASGRACGAL